MQVELKKYEAEDWYKKQGWAWFTDSDGTHWRETGLLIVTREEDDEKFYGDLGGRGASRFLYHLKQVLNDELGTDLIKKKMADDGHLVSEYQYYLRPRKPSGDPLKDIAVVYPYFALRASNDDFNDGEVEFEVIFDWFDQHSPSDEEDE